LAEERRRLCPEIFETPEVWQIQTLVIGDVAQTESRLVTICKTLGVCAVSRSCTDDIKTRNGVMCFRFQDLPSYEKLRHTWEGLTPDLRNVVTIFSTLAASVLFR
jgi:hypothetical protein